MTEEAPGKSKRRGLVGFYIAMGVLVALAVGFYFAWTPLRVSYTIHKIRSAPKTVQSRGELLLRQERILYCLERASQGHRLAMAGIVEGLTDGSFNVRVKSSYGFFHIPDLAYVAARTQPRLFYEELNRRTDEQALHVLWQISDQSGRRSMMPGGKSLDHLNFEVPYVRGTSESSPEAMVWLGARLKSASEKAANPDDRAVPKSALDYLRQRFASQLGTAPATESGARK